MVGKIKRIRQKLHQGAVKMNHELLGSEEAPTPAKGKVEPFFSFIKSTSDDSFRKDAPKDKTENKTKRLDVIPSSVFAGTKITPEALVQSLKIEQPPVNLSQTASPADRKQQPKRQKMKERRERWLNKISTIKLAREQQVEAARRRATPVVGDMRLLADALPELSQLVSTSRAPRCRKTSVPVKRKPGPTDFSQMKPTQKRKLLETESSRFSEMLTSPSFRTNPLATIGEHLRKKMKEEEEQRPT